MNQPEQIAADLYAKYRDSGLLPYEIASALAAAEERGRRAGITPELLNRVLHVLGKVAAGQEDSWTSTIARGIEIELRKTLAPRDSAKESRK